MAEEYLASESSTRQKDLRIPVTLSNMDSLNNESPVAMSVDELVREFSCHFKISKEVYWLWLAYMYITVVDLTPLSLA